MSDKEAEGFGRLDVTIWPIQLCNQWESQLATFNDNST